MEVSTYSAMIKRINYLELEVYDFGSAVLDAKWHGKNSRFPTNRLYLPKSGAAFIGTASQKIQMQPGMAYLVPAGAQIDYLCDTSMEKLYFHFNLFKPDKYDALQCCDRIYEIPVHSGLLNSLYFHADADTVYDAFIIKSILYDLLSLFQNKYRFICEDIPVYSKTVMSVISYIHENLSASLHLEELAGVSYVSRSALSEQFRKEIGISIGKYIDDQLIAEAQRRLSQTTYTIGQISDALGYSNQCYFSRRFKQLCGMTPQLYRIQNKV